MEVKIRLKAFMGALLCTYALLLGGHILALYFLIQLERPNALGIVPVFHFDREANLPTLFSGFQLACAGLCAFGISKFERSKSGGSPRHWFIIGCILLFIGIDDMAHLHENLDTIIMSRVETSGLIHWPWVIPYSILALIVAGYFLPFFLKLPSHLKFYFALSAGMFVTGAIGLEMFAARHAQKFGEETTTYAIFMTIEESLEMLSITLLLYGLLSHMVKHLGGLRGHFEVSR
ncbi:MAG: hypothetical protein P1U86_12170 [Verrucomicrobiales bacterium]|nr:hypothetical protein [Verrucomicrobiales bacterium]